MYLILVSFALATISSCSNSISGRNEGALVHVRKTDSGYRLIRNGKPFFIKGGGGDGYLTELKAAGGNTIRVYDPEKLPEIIKQAEQLDIAVIADIPIPRASYPEFYTDPEKFLEVKNTVAKIVSTYKNSPGLLYWNLGNEILYPDMTDGSGFFEKYNELIKLVHELDPNHPVSTAVIGGNRRRLASIAVNSPGLDFLSFNTFGNIHELEERMQSISLLWEGPYVISEWGINGPWEEKKTAWEAPIEQLPDLKAATIHERYENYISLMNQNNCMGNIIFYWGNKQEATPTWYSIFSEDGKKSLTYYQVSEFWRKAPLKYEGPTIKNLLIDKKTADDNIILTAGDKTSFEIELNDFNLDSVDISWELREEAWYKPEELPRKIQGSKLKDSLNAIFEVPDNEGPYRLYINVSNGENFSSANIPFYVLNPANVQ